MELDTSYEGGLIDVQRKLRVVIAAVWNWQSLHATIGYATNRNLSTERTSTYHCMPSLIVKIYIV